MATMMTTTRTRGDGALAPSPMTTGGLVIPAKAATYPNAARPDSSTLSRRVRGVLSPYRERGIRALARPQDGARCAPSPSHPRGHVIPAKAGTYWRAPMDTRFLPAQECR